jgi:hypothetical protein
MKRPYKPRPTMRRKYELTRSPVVVEEGVNEEPPPGDQSTGPSRESEEPLKEASELISQATSAVNEQGRQVRVGP